MRIATNKLLRRTFILVGLTAIALTLAAIVLPPQGTSAVPRAGVGEAASSH
jgi:hypothetical protein